MSINLVIPDEFKGIRTPQWLNTLYVCEGYQMMEKACSPLTPAYAGYHADIKNLIFGTPQYKSILFAC